jgi:hypothetical protein
MAQTTTAISRVDGQVEFSTDNSTWTDISGSITSVDPGEQGRDIGEEYVLEGDLPVMGEGKSQTLEITCKGLWSPTAGEAFAVVKAAWEARGRCYLRWSPQGGATGDKRYTTSYGYLTGFMWPKVDATDAKPMPCGFKLKTGKITESTISA